MTGPSRATLSPLSIFFIAAIAYTALAQLLALRAHRYRVDPERLMWPLDIFRPALFRPEGQRARRLAARFLVAGVIVALGIAMAAFLANSGYGIRQN